MIYNYDPNKYDPKAAYALIPEGPKRLMVEEVEETTSKSGKAMIKVVFAVVGTNSKLYKYFVDGDGFQRSIDPFFESCGIDYRTALNDPTKWVGARGACVVKHVTNKQTGRLQAEINKFLSRQEQAELSGGGGQVAPAPQQTHDEPPFPTEPQGADQRRAYMADENAPF